jgi:glutamate/tyrosine decarboxylase-like PLP-dependent enzyme
MRIPEKGIQKEEIFKVLESYKVKDLDWRSGKVMGYVYDPGHEAEAVIHRAYTMYLAENGLDPLTYPSLLRLETELVEMIAGLLHGDADVAGNFTSGGTESLLLAVKTARDMAKEVKPHIKQPEMILPLTAHASFYKAAHYFDIKPVVTEVNKDSFRADVAAIRNAVTDNTILIVGSAPSYAHGVVDPIADMGKVAMENDILFHVDSCVGGIHLSYMRKLGYEIPDFDFKVPGVTSISVDLHKYGYAAKGASLILYKNKDIRKYQMFACSRWPGYTVINPAVTSSKTGGPLAAAWAVVRYLGDEGYMKIVKEVMEATKIVIDGVKTIEGLRVLGEPDMCMFSFTSTSDEINIYRLADMMKTEGWYIQPQFEQQCSPANLHISMNRSSVPRSRDLLKALEECVQHIMEKGDQEEDKNFREEVKKLSGHLDDEAFFKLVTLAGITGNELPEKMEKVNQILDALPDDITESLLIEFLNNLMVSSGQE